MDLSTIGVKFGWAVETTKGTKPTAFTQILGCISIGGVELTKDNIETTPLEVRKKTYVGGYEDTGGELAVGFNYNDEFVDAWSKLTAASDTAKESGLATWFTAYHPNMQKANFYIVEPGSMPAPEFAPGNALQVTISNTLNDFVGLQTAIEPTLPSSGGA